MSSLSSDDIPVPPPLPQSPSPAEVPASSSVGPQIAITKKTGTPTITLPTSTSSSIKSAERADGIGAHPHQPQRDQVISSATLKKKKKEVMFPPLKLLLIFFYLFVIAIFSWHILSDPFDIFQFPDNVAQLDAHDSSSTSKNSPAENLPSYYRLNQIFFDLIENFNRFKIVKEEVNKKLSRRKAIPDATLEQEFQASEDLALLSSSPSASSSPNTTLIAISIFFFTVVVLFFFTKIFHRLHSSFNKADNSNSIRLFGSKRIITFSDDEDDAQGKSFDVFPSPAPKTEETRRPTTATNFISSTFQGSKPKVAAYSFLYGGMHYLKDTMQLYCIGISILQLFFFNSLKSFLPLAIFTVIIALFYTVEQLKCWEKDLARNSSPVRIFPNKELFSERGKLVPGQTIVIRAGEEVPADLVIRKAFIHQQANGSMASPSSSSSSSSDIQHRTTFSVNESQVTGETKAISKSVPKIDDGYQIDSIEIHELGKNLADLHTKKKSSTNKNDMKSISLNENNILFSNSRILTTIPDLFVVGTVGWVGSETKALKNPTAGLSNRRHPTPFSYYSKNGFFVNLVFLLVSATLTALLAYYTQDEYRSSSTTAPGKSFHRFSFLAVWVMHLLYLNMLGSSLPSSFSS